MEWQAEKRICQPKAGATGPVETFEGRTSQTGSLVVVESWAGEEAISPCKLHPAIASS